MGVPLPADRHDAGIEYLGTPGGICGNIKIVNELVAVLPAESVAGRDGSTAADGDQRQRCLKALDLDWVRVYPENHLRNVSDGFRPSGSGQNQCFIDDRRHQSLLKPRRQVLEAEPYPHNLHTSVLLVCCSGS
ncbi:uncharacterized protein PG998_013763 [Apiospora kogelbergensis]|uniref:Uncharacterized protein n=1 Tax=Apiospora kogelbergensis TaxID=1337665 RepID=A0AAW0R0B9_9PEZI